MADACARGAGRGALGGLIASVPVFGPALASLCTACVGGGAAVAGVGIGLVRWPFVAAGVTVLLASGGLTVRRARRSLPPGWRARSVLVSLVVAGATAVATYVVVNIVLVPAARIAAQQLSTAFEH